MWDDLSLVGDALPSPTYSEQVDVMSMRDSYQQQNSAQPAIFEHPCAALKKILSSGSFYYALSPHWDISSRLAERLSRDSGVADLGGFDYRFVWNEYIVRSLLDFRERLDMQEREDLDRCQFIVSPARSPSAFASFLNNRTGSYYPRLRGRLHDRAPCTPNEWRSNHRNAQPHFSLGR